MGIRFTTALLSTALAGMTAGCWQGQGEMAPMREAKAAEPLPQCTAQQLLAAVPGKAEVEAHRQFALPTIDYPAGTEKDFWGMSVILRVTPEGQPECYALEDRFRRDVPLDPERSAFLAAIRSWRYLPFTRDGSATPAIVTEDIREQELPGTHVPMPDVALSDVSISLRRTGCYGTCPSYRVTVRGDGTATYEGDAFVDVEGEHHYTVPVEEVAALVERIREDDLWSMRSNYQAAITDHPSYALVIRMGDRTKPIRDYVGKMAGMPEVISEFEDEVDRVARSDQWVSLGMTAVERLEAEGFRFASQEGADLLARAVSNPASSDVAIARLIALGAPIRGGKTRTLFGTGETHVLEAALRNRHAGLVQPLVDAGAWSKDGRVDQPLVDAAFRAAVAGGSLPAVEEVWRVAGEGSRPALTFRDETIEEERTRRKRAPVVLLLDPYAARHDTWDGLAIAQWFAARGGDLGGSRANGDTLLHAAASGNDLAFVAYLLEQGLDPSAAGEFGLPALGSTEDEDVALLLLQAGTDIRPLDEGRPFIEFARSRHWGRVVAWLERANE